MLGQFRSVHGQSREAVSQAQARIREAVTTRRIGARLTIRRKARPRRRSKSIAEGRFELFDGAIAGNYLKKCRNMK
jgi:hypothetical protein